MGVLSEYLPQRDITEDYTEPEQKEVFQIELGVWQELEARQDNFWISLPPKRRREILSEAQLERVSSQRPTRGSDQEKELKEDSLISSL